MSVYFIKGDPTSVHVCSRFCNYEFALCRQQVPNKIKHGPYSFYYCDRSNLVHMCGPSFCDRQWEVDAHGTVHCGLTGLVLNRIMTDDVTRVLSHRARYDRPARKKQTHEIGPSTDHWASQIAVRHWAWSGNSILCGCPPIMGMRGGTESPKRVEEEESMLKALYKNAGRESRLLAKITVSVMLSSPQFAVVIHRRTKTLMGKAVASATSKLKEATANGPEIVMLPDLMKAVCHEHFPRGTITIDPITFMHVVETLAEKISSFWIQYFKNTQMSAEVVAALLYLSAEGWSSSQLVVKSNLFLATVLVPRRSLSLWGINPQCAPHQNTASIVI